MTSVRARAVLLAALLLLALGTAGVWIAHCPSERSLLESLIPLAILAAASFWLLRHAGLAAVTIIAPLPGFFAATLAASFVLPNVWNPSAYLPGFLIAGLAASRIAVRAAEGQTREAAAREVLGILALPALCALALDAGVLACDRNWVQPLVVVCSGLSAIAFVPLAASLLPYGEEFAARANRVREWRERWLARLAPAFGPRWGWSLSGVAVVLVVLGIFGAGRRIAFGDPAWFAPLTAAIVVAIFALRDWRRALAALLAFLPVLFLALWLCAGTGSSRNLAASLGLGLMAMILMAAHAAAFARQGEPAGVASARAVEEYGAAVALALFACALVFALGSDVAAVFAAAFASLATLVFAAAFAAAIETLAPRRAAIEARYRVG